MQGSAQLPGALTLHRPHSLMCLTCVPCVLLVWLVCLCVHPTHPPPGAPLPGPSSSSSSSREALLSGPGSSSALITYARQLNEAESNLLLTGVSVVWGAGDVSWGKECLGGGVGLEVGGLRGGA